MKTVYGQFAVERCAYMIFQKFDNFRDFGKEFLVVTLLMRDDLFSDKPFMNHENLYR